MADYHVRFSWNASIYTQHLVSVVWFLLLFVFVFVLCLIVCFYFLLFWGDLFVSVFCLFGVFVCFWFLYIYIYIYIYIYMMTYGSNRF